MSTISFADKLVKSGSIPIHLVRCKDDKGRDCYFFIMCAGHKISALKAAKSGEFDLKDYGKIIASGFGAEPSQEIKDMLKKEYDFDADTLVGS